MQERSVETAVDLALDVLKSKVSVHMLVKLGLAVVRDKSPDQHLYRHEETPKAMKDWVLFFLDAIDGKLDICSTPRQAAAARWVPYPWAGPEVEGGGQTKQMQDWDPQAAGMLSLSQTVCITYPPLVSSMSWQ
jgi:hypothetical protein